LEDIVGEESKLIFNCKKINKGVFKIIRSEIKTILIINNKTPLVKELGI
jgi:hypothetical protein